MSRFFWVVTKGYRLRPWRSPYLRWRIETYQGGHAEKITASDFWHFLWQNRRELVRYARWAERMRKRAGSKAGAERQRETGLKHRA